MDTTHLENIAEDLIAHELQRGGLLVAKPKFDRKGADLIALMEINDAAKFCKIQCKGRSLKNSTKTNITFPEEYLTHAFVLILYIENDDNRKHLFCFFNDDIKNKWKLVKRQKNPQKSNYYLYINKNSLSDQILPGDLANYYFNINTIDRIKDVIRTSHSAIEIRLFEIIEQQQELYKITKRKNDLVNLLKELKQLEDMIDHQGELIESYVGQFELACEKYKSELPEGILNKIEALRDSFCPEDGAIEIIVRDIGDSISREALELFISYMYNTHRNKLLS